MPSLLGQLNCFSKKTRRRRRRHGEDGDDEHKQPLVSPGGSNSTSPTSSRTSPGSKASKGSKGSKTSRGSKQSSKQPSLTLNHRTPRHDEDDSIPTFDSGYRNIKSSNYSVSDAGGTTGTPGKSLSGFSQSAAGFGSPAGAFGSVAGDDSLERKLYDAYPSNLIQSPVQRRKEEMIEVHAPKGKLGLVVDAPDDALTPVVHAVKDSCPIRDEICVGDRLVAVDDVDVREMTAVEVSRLLSRKSGQERRKLTIIRTSR